MHDPLEEAYRRAIYRVDDGDVRLELRLDERSPALDELLDASGATTWAFLTAWNPGSVRVSDADNARNQAALREAVAAYDVLEGEGLAPDGSWREPSVLAIGMPLDAARGLAGQLGQRAFVWGRRGEPATLVFTADSS